MPPTTLNLAAETSQGPEGLKFEAERLICCGWAGRDRAALQAHIDELALLEPTDRVSVPLKVQPGITPCADGVR